MKNRNPQITGKHLLFPVSERINAFIFFVLIFLLQVIPIFQGLDLSDEGFLSIFYQRIFSNPDSVSYNFMFWLTGIFGGIWVKLFSPLGLLGIRLAGALVNTMTAVLAYNLLRKHLKTENLRIGLLLVVLCLNNDIKVINYNTLSSLFFIVVISFLYYGLLNNRIEKLFLGGCFVGLSVFLRTPNILELGLALGIVYYHYLFKSPSTVLIKQLLAFILGFFTAVGIVILAMLLLGHLQIFIGSLKLLFSMGKSDVSPATTQNAYGLSRLIYIFRSNTIQSLKYAIIVFFFVFGGLLVASEIKSKFRYGNSIAKTLVCGFIIILLILIINHSISHFTILFFLMGLILITAIPIAFSTENSEIKLLLFFGIFFQLTYPLGSSDGIYTAGRYCLWISLPLVIDYLLSIRSFDNALIVKWDKEESVKKFGFTEQQVFNVQKILTGVLIFAGCYQLLFYPFFDRRNRIHMDHSLLSENLKGIFTTKGRAETFNELLSATARYAKPNDFLLAYDHIAMVYYATNTIPFLTNSLPSVYSAQMFKADLDSSLVRNRRLPIVIMQRIATTGDASKWPEEILPGNYAENELNRDRNLILDSFLIKYNYQETWENTAFKILVPGK